MTIQTTQLNNGQTVLAGKDRAGYFGAKSYTNYTQAIKQVEKLQAAGINASLYEVLSSSVCKYVAIGA